MNTRVLSVISGLSVVSGLALAQPSVPAPPPSQSSTQAASALAGAISPQMLISMMSAAANFHELVSNLNKSLGPDQHVLGADGQYHHPLERTAATIGAGAGAGAALGALSHNQNGMVIGAIIGGAGGLVVDQVLKHREELRARAEADNAANAGFNQGGDPAAPPRQLIERPR